MNYLQIKDWLQNESGLHPEQIKAHPGLTEIFEKFYSFATQSLPPVTKGVSAEDGLPEMLAKYAIFYLANNDTFSGEDFEGNIRTAKDWLKLSGIKINNPFQEMIWTVLNKICEEGLTTTPNSRDWVISKKKEINEIISSMFLTHGADVTVQGEEKNLCKWCNGNGFITNGLMHDDEDYREEDCETCKATGYNQSPTVTLVEVKDTGGEDAQYIIYKNDKVNSVLGAAMRNLSAGQLTALRDALISRTPADKVNEDKKTAGSQTLYNVLSHFQEVRKVANFTEGTDNYHIANNGIAMLEEFIETYLQDKASTTTAAGEGKEDWISVKAELESIHGGLGKLNVHTIDVYKEQIEISLHTIARILFS